LTLSVIFKDQGQNTHNHERKCRYNGRCDLDWSFSGRIHFEYEALLLYCMLVRT